MPAIPLIPLAIAGGAALAKAIPSIIRSPQEKANAKRLRELEAMGDSMGLTPEEKANLTMGYAGQLEEVQRAGERQAAGALANAAAGSGAALQRAGAAQDQRIRAGREAATSINQLDAARRTELEGELEDRYAFQAAARGQRAKALLSVPGAVLGQGLEEFSQAKLLGQGQKVITPEVAQAAATVPPADMAALYKSLTPEQRAEVKRIAAENGYNPPVFDEES